VKGTSESPPSAVGEAQLVLFGITSLDRKYPHFTNHFILSLDKAMVVGVREFDDFSVWHLFEKEQGFPCFANDDASCSTRT
jgi:hypothetical protein